MNSGKPKIPRSIELLKNNILDSMHPFRLELSNCGIWCRGEIKPTILYSGCLYSTMQIVLSKERFIELVTKDPSRDIFSIMASIYVKLGPLYRRFIRITQGRLIDIAAKAFEILNFIGYEVGCLKREPYPGMLLYELGYINEFKDYANRVYSILKEEGVKEIITIDPHVYELLKYIYPEYVDGYDLKIQNFLDIVIEAYRRGDIRFKSVNGESIAFHDPCHYSKSSYRRIINEPRELLKAMGYTLKEPFRSREMSMCCGGPIETYFSTLAREVAKRRLKELKGVDSDLIGVACPICLTSFLSVSGEGYRIMDIIELIYERMVR